MQTPASSPSSPLARRTGLLNPLRKAAGCLLGLLLAFAPVVWAEKADRSKPMVVESDLGGTIDYQRQLVIYTGNVVISQGSMLLRADRIEMRETTDGYRMALALGSAARPASWRQRRDGPDETVEGSAERIEFDGKADTLRFVGNSAVRRLRGSTVADEVTGARILWDNTTEIFKVEGGNVSPTNPSGRVRAVLSPRVETGTVPGGQAAPASAPASTTPGSLAPSRAIGERR